MIRTFISFFAILVFVPQIEAQENASIAEWKARYDKANLAKDKLECSIALAKAYKTGIYLQFDSVLHYAQIAERLALEQMQDEETAEVYALLGYVQMGKNRDYKAAKEYYDLALGLARKLKKVPLENLMESDATSVSFFGRELIDTCKKLLQKYEQQGDSAAIAKTKMHLGRAYNNLYPVKAHNYIKEAKEYYDGKKDREKSNLLEGYFAVYYTAIYQRDKALQTLKMAMDTAKKEGWVENELMNIYNFIPLCIHEDSATANNLINRAKHLRQKHGITYMEDALYSTLITRSLAISDYAKARHYVTILSNESVQNDNKQGIMYAVYYKGNVCTYEGWEKGATNFDSSFIYYDSAMQICQTHFRQQDKKMIESIYLSKGYALDGAGKHREALELYFLAEPFMHEYYGYAQLALLYRAIADNYNSLGDYETAYQYATKSDSFENISNELERVKTVESNLIAFKTRETEDSLVQSRHQIQLKNSEVAATRMTNTLLGILLLVTVFAMVTLWVLWRRSNRQKQKINTQKTQIEVLQKDTEMSYQILTHDSKNHLQQISLSLANLLDSGNAWAKDIYERIYALTFLHGKLDALKTVQQEIATGTWFYEIFENVMASSSIPLLQKKFTDQLPRSHKITPRTAYNTGVALTELLRNCLKHAFDNNNTAPFIEVTVTLQPNNHRVLLQVQDNGCGFKGDWQVSTGLNTIQTLMNNIQAQVAIKNNEKGGLVELIF